MSATREPSVGQSAFALDVTELRSAEEVAVDETPSGLSVRVRRGRGNLWLIVACGGRDAAVMRAGHPGAELRPEVSCTRHGDELVFEFASALGAWRAKISFPSDEGRTVRCTTSLLPAEDLSIPFWPRDLYVLDAPDGTVHTSQRGLRSGIVFASSEHPEPQTLFYFQDFSSSSDFFSVTKRSPSGCVGGSWPELGYAVPAGEDCVLPRSREFVVSDAYLTVVLDAPRSEGEVAATYLDLFAETYAALPRPPVAYHDWPGRAARALHDLSTSPACTSVLNGRRYLNPYVADQTKPPESMVQLTLAVNTAEYDRWRGQESGLATMLRNTAPSFFDEEIGSIVRWLPGALFASSQSEENMNHDAMDSWYLHHALFNLLRLASEGDVQARALLERSLPFAVRVAHRFDYTWPVFFSLHTLDVIRAEAEPGKGGEHDVGGLFALVMLHAHELFGDAEYLEEAQRAAERLRGLGFRLGYQMNTTGFAAEAAMRLWKKTRQRAYLELSEICIANLFDNMWVWQSRYGHASAYATYFGLFPLPEAPYLAAYEELEAQAKFHDYLAIAADDLRPSLRFLLAEFQKYSIHRAWFYYPDALPRDAVADKPRNGRVESALSVPLEDLRDGWEQSGQVGQEIYGAGLPFVYTSRHYKAWPAHGCLLFCDYPMYDFEEDSRSCTWRAGGDARGSGELRVIPVDTEMNPVCVEVMTRAGKVDVPLHGAITPEGHALFPIRGGQMLMIRFGDLTDDIAPAAVEIGGIRRGADLRS